jgi:hypothetical protein
MTEDEWKALEAQLGAPIKRMKKDEFDAMFGRILTEDVRYCFKCLSEMENTADLCPNCGVSQEAYKKAFTIQSPSAEQSKVKKASAGTGGCFCFECDSPVDCEADVCSNCGASQIPYKKAFFRTIAKRFITSAAALIGSLTLAGLLLTAIDEALKYFGVRNTRISNETSGIVFLVIVVVVIIAIVFFGRDRKGVESKLNLKD